MDAVRPIGASGPVRCAFCPDGDGPEGARGGHASFGLPRQAPRRRPASGASPRAPVVLGPLSAAGLRRAIVEPARRRGVQVDPDLVDHLVEACRDATGTLPLLQFALRILWEQRNRATGRISIADLQALGGLTGALAMHADAVIARMTLGLQAEARRVLLALVTVEGTRARREAHDLSSESPAFDAVLDALVEGRLVVASAGEESTAYEVAHEVLLTGWPRLRAWIDEESAGREVFQRLNRAATEWERLGHGAEALFGERQLAELEILADRSLPPNVVRFVSESRAEVRRARVRLWVRRIGTPALAVVALAAIGGGVRWRERRQTHAFVAAQLAEADINRREWVALGDQVEAARARAFALYDAHDAAGGEARWRDALTLATRESAAFATAIAPLGLALARDPLDPETRMRAADLAYHWLLSAERNRQFDVARDLQTRLAQFDVDGSRRAQLAAPAHLRVTTDPLVASVVLHAVLLDGEDAVRKDRVVRSTWAHLSTLRRGRMFCPHRPRAVTPRVCHFS